MNIILAGMPASGKTTVGKILAANKNMSLVDTDEIIVSSHGEINNIFKERGEEYFRNLETQAVKTASGKKNAVISTGGGCLMRRENAAMLKKGGKIVYLRTGLDALVERTQGDTTRPLLKGGAKERLKTLMSQRSAVYEREADIIVDTDGLSPELVAKRITELLK